MMTAKEVGKRAKAERKRAKLSQQQVADHFGVKKGTVSRWETGFTEIPLSALIKLAHLYRCSPYAILLDPPDPQTAAEQEQAL
jgi:transcriptional regulator with XRE-family HTH domain